jgi:hypothetical protein
MFAMETLEQLWKLMPPPASPIDALGDWDRVESDLGTRLPRDYKLYTAAYGSGTIGKLPVWIFNPFAADPMHRLKEQAECIFRAYRTLIEGGYELPYPLFPKSNGLLPCGRTGNGDYLHWRTTGSPDHWSIVVWQCGEVEFKTFATRNLVAFLGDLVAGRLEVFPTVFFKPTPQFIPALSKM